VCACRVRVFACMHMRGLAHAVVFCVLGGMPLASVLPDTCVGLLSSPFINAAFWYSYSWQAHTVCGGVL